MSLPPPSTLLDLPTELLVEIHRKSANPNFPIVCSYLRDTIHGTSSFWAYVYLGEKQNLPEAASLLSKRLKQGVTCPLDVVIRAREPLNARAAELWLLLSTQKERIRTFDIGTDTVALCGTILKSILLMPHAPSPLPLLLKLDIRHDEDLDVPYLHNPMDPAILLHPMPSLFPSLTTLVLPLLCPCIPYPELPILSLKTLVLDGSMSWSCDYPVLIEVAQFLAQTPQLETFWCKEHRLHTYQSLSNLNALPPDPFAKLRVTSPVFLPRLTKIAVIVPGFGIDLLHAIDAPALRDLHMDGTRDEEEYVYDEVAWLDWYPMKLEAGLRITASRSPALRRISLVGAYLTRDTWEWLLGCGEVHDVPFPLLEDIALHNMKAVKDDVTNTFDELLMEQYAKRGRITLRRVAYLTSDPPLRGGALHRLINGVASKQVPDIIFELELDGAFGIHMQKRLKSLLSKGVRVILHEKPPQRKSWWTLGKDIDPTDAEFY